MGVAHAVQYIIFDERFSENKQNLSISSKLPSPLLQNQKNSSSSTSPKPDMLKLNL